MANIKECDYVNIDPKVVERFESRIARLLKDMDKYGLSLFCGSSGSIRYYHRESGRSVVVGAFRGDNHDGGDGAAREDDDGIEVGENRG